MKLILRADVENLGSLGDVVEVKPGYGRNYLLPQGLAMVASPANLKVFEQEALGIGRALGGAVVVIVLSPMPNRNCEGGADRESAADFFGEAVVEVRGREFVSSDNAEFGEHRASCETFATFKKIDSLTEHFKIGAAGIDLVHFGDVRSCPDFGAGEAFVGKSEVAAQGHPANLGESHSRESEAVLYLGLHYAGFVEFDFDGEQVAASCDPFVEHGLYRIVERVDESYE